MHTMKKYFSGILLLLIMAGCGSSSPKTTGKGVYVDSVVWGVKYICGDERGITDEYGRFTYEIGKECRFYIDNFAFKKIDASIFENSQVTIQEGDVVIARFLQTLDIDGDATNGINITPSVAKNITKIARNDQEIEELVDRLKSKVSNYDGKVVSLEEAKEHLDKSIKIKTSLSAIFSVSSKSVKQGESITFDASSSRGNIESYTWKKGSKVLATGPIYTTSNLSLGKNIITLYVKGENGEIKSKSQEITILPPATKWDLVTPIIQKNLNKLYITSDDANIYLKFDSNDSMSVDKLKNINFYLNTDDSDISGLKTGTIGKGLDYMVTNEGVFHLRSEDDYKGIKVQELNSAIKDHMVEVVIDRKNIEYLAENISVSIRIEDMNFTMYDHTKKYKISPYIQPEDKVAPVITITGENPLSVNVDDTYVELGATATDVIDGVAEVTILSSDINTSNAGIYQVVYSAEDSKGNKAVKHRVVEVKGASSIKTFEVKTVGEYNDTIAINHENNQVWMNDDRGIGKNRGCLVATTGLSASELKKEVESFCKYSDFAGFSDWRAPTSIELSKFTIKMRQENQLVGMERKNCVRTLSVDEDGSVKAVNTHKIPDKLIGLIRTDILTPAGARCVRGEIDNSTGAFTIKEENGGRVIVDDTLSSKSLIWVNEYDKSKKACLAIHTQEKLENSKEFCQNLDYAGHNDWRMPTSVELSNFIIKTDEVHILPGYEASCKRLLAKDENSSKAVYTRFDHTHTLGEVLELEQNLSSSIGLRCVRDN